MCNKFSFYYFILPALFLAFSACNTDTQNTAMNPDKDSVAQSNVFAADSFAFYENVLKSDSLNTELHFALAINYYTEKQFEKAIEHLLIVCRIDHKNTEALITLGNIYYDAEQNDKAIETYEKLLQLDDKNVNVRCDLATSYLNNKDIQKSFRLLTENIKIAPNHAQSHHNLSVVYSQMGKTKEAEAEMKIFNKLSVLK
ncbi:MAG: tetratricopeptide repeat protein [Bacteroidota bacterium]